MFNALKKLLVHNITYIVIFPCYGGTNTKGFINYNDAQKFASKNRPSSIRFYVKGVTREGGDLLDEYYELPVWVNGW